MVNLVKLPAKSRLHTLATTRDFLDCYAVPSKRSPRSAGEIIFDYPMWTRALLKMRNLIVAPFGLTTEETAAADKIGVFPVESESPDELIIGFNDKHLDFRISILAEREEIFLATWVRTHNMGGRLYLGMVMPFHVLIIRDAMRRLGAS